ncbi:MAG: CPBP family glutamic-type intramembrane protease [Myxococcota bacterium]
MRFFLGAALATVGLALAAAEVTSLETDERDVAGEWVLGGGIAADGVERNASAVRLVGTELVEGQRAAFELCVIDASPEALAGARAEIRYVGVDPAEVAGSIALNERFTGLQRIDDAFCLTLFHWERVLVEGPFEVTLEGAPQSARLRGRVLAWRAPNRPGRLGILLLLVGLLIVAFSQRSTPKAMQREGYAGLETPETRDAVADLGTKPASASRPLGRLLLGLALFIGIMVGLAYVPASQAFSALLRGGGIAAAGAALAFSLGTNALAFRWPTGRGLGTAALLVMTGVGAFVLGRYLSGLVPSTGIAPIEMVLAAPSGSLALAAVSILAPLAEELFFRGFAFGMLQARFSTAVAAVGSVVLFAVVHLPQQWGAWGAFISVSVAGVIFTAVRVKTGSSLASGLAHLSHNAFITLLALA